MQNEVIYDNVVENISKEVDARYYLREYDEVLAGNRRNYSSACMSRNNGGKMIAEILDYIFRDYLHWSHTEARDCLTPEIVRVMKLDAFIKRIPCPPEVQPRLGELYYVAWYIYPETRNATRIDLVKKVYVDVLEGRISKFPKGYFDGNDGYSRARILLLTMIREFLSFSSAEEMYAYFAGEEGQQAIREHKLSVPLRELYSSPLDFLHDALGEAQGNNELYVKYNAQVRRRADRGYIDVEAKAKDRGSNVMEVEAIEDDEEDDE